MFILSHTIQKAHIPCRINIGKSVLHPCEEMNFLRIKIDSIKNGFVIDTREGAKSCQNLSEPSQELFYNSFGIDKGYGSPLIHYTSSGTCKDSVNISSTTTNCVSQGKYELSVGSNIKHQVKNQLNLVDKEFEVLQ